MISGRLVRGVLTCCSRKVILATVWRHAHQPLRPARHFSKLVNNGLRTAELGQQNLAGRIMQLSYTCVVCGSRESKRILKANFKHFGVLVTCGSCNSCHMIADNLGFEGKKTVEQIYPNAAKTSPSFSLWK